MNKNTNDKQAKHNRIKQWQNNNNAKTNLESKQNKNILESIKRRGQITENTNNNKNNLNKDTI